MIVAEVDQSHITFIIFNCRVLTNEHAFSSGSSQLQALTNSVRSLGRYRAILSENKRNMKKGTASQNVGKRVKLYT